MGNVACYEALNHAKAATVIPLTALYPVVTVLLAVPVLKERIALAHRRVYDLADPAKAISAAGYRNAVSLGARVELAKHGVLLRDRPACRSTGAENARLGSDFTVECTASTDPADTGSATATDNCDAAPAVTHSDAVTPGACWSIR